MSSSDADHKVADLVFRGGGGHECERFIQDIRKRAFALGKQRDGNWMADYASTCFYGDALRWFEALGADTQTDWSRLREALLKRYPPDEAPPYSHDAWVSSIVPTAAAARTPGGINTKSPAAAELLYSPWLSNLLSAIQRGVVQITTVQDGSTFYLSKQLGKGPTTTGFARAVRTDSDALQVRMQSTSTVQRIFTDVQSPEASYLACHPYDATVDMSPMADRPYYGMLTLVNISESGSLSSSISLRLKGVKPHRRFQIDMWQLEPSGDISAFVVDDSTGQAHKVLPYVAARLTRSEPSTWVVFLENISWWNARNPGKLQPARLTFVPSK